MGRTKRFKAPNLTGVAFCRPLWCPGKCNGQLRSQEAKSSLLGLGFGNAGVGGLSRSAVPHWELWGQFSQPGPKVGCRGVTGPLSRVLHRRTLETGVTALKPFSWTEGTVWPAAGRREK